MSNPDGQTDAFGEETKTPFVIMSSKCMQFTMNNNHDSALDPPTAASSSSLDESPLAAQAWSIDDENNENTNISGIISVEEEDDEPQAGNNDHESNNSDNNDDDMPEADYSHLDLSFDDITEFDQTVTGGPSVAVAAAASNPLPPSPVKPKVYYNDHPDDNMMNDDNDNHNCDYILGTLIVRVVAARDLPPQKEEGHNWFFGSSSSSNNHHHHHRRGGANPYASVRFGNTIQRTSQVFDAIDPIWPRGENMYLDVTHPAKSTQQKSSDEQTTDETDINHTHSTPVAAAAASSSDSSPHPGDPPSKDSKKPASSKTAIQEKQQQSSSSSSSRRQPPRPVLTVALFHSNATAHDEDPQKQLYNPPKKPTKNNNNHGDSDDIFLGMTAIDVTTLLTGKEAVVDAWCPLTGGPPPRHHQKHNHHHNHKPNLPSVRLVCEYEASDAPPQPGDLVRFSGYCRAADVYPLNHDTVYKVQEHPYDEHHHHAPPDYSLDDDITISYTSTEGWVCTHTAHRYMLLCEERQQGLQSLQEYYQGEFLTLGQRIARSPLVSTLQDVAVHRIPDEGLVSVGVAAFQGAGDLFQKWMNQGVQSAVDDVMHVTNLDGHNDVSAEQSLAMDDDDDDEIVANSDPDGASQNVVEGNPVTEGTQLSHTGGGVAPNPLHSMPASPAKKSSSWQSLPNMPCCPITGEPMDDPVVAADGHTYERTAIARWLQSSDKSPLTGSVLPHKNLVPNYMLLSSLQEAQLKSTTSSSSAVNTAIANAKDDSPPNTDATSDLINNDMGANIILPSNSSTEDLVDHDLSGM